MCLFSAVDFFQFFLRIRLSEMEGGGGSNGGMLYHEVQESKLCALHCVNAVLQGPFFSELDLAALASDLDRQERRMMLDDGDSLRFDSQVSHNVSMDGDFSIQVRVLVYHAGYWVFFIILLMCN